MLNLTDKQLKIFKYLKQDIRNVSKGNEAFIKFFFPENLIFYDYLPSFCDDSSPVFLIDSSKDKSKKSLMDMMPNLVVLFQSTKNTLDGKKGFLTILTDVLGMKINDTLLKGLNGFDDSDYWLTVKLWYVLDEVLEFETENKQSSSTFNLFKCLFVFDYGTLYKHYVESEEPYHKVFSALLTMMTKTKDVYSLTGVTPYYKKILEGHSNYLPVFKKAVYNYAQTNVTELDFLNFLYQCSNSYER